MKTLENYIAPTEHSQGDVGDIWIDKSTGDVYKCTGITGSAKDLGYITIGADATNTKYIWEKLGGGGMTKFYGNDDDGYLYWDDTYTQKVTQGELREAFNKGVIYVEVNVVVGAYVATHVDLGGDFGSVSFIDVNNDDYSFRTSEWVNNGPPV